MKAVCVLESILRKKDDDHFSAIGAYFSERKDVVVRCSESPQASLREKANKVNALLLNVFRFFSQCMHFLPCKSWCIISVVC